MQIVSNGINLHDMSSPVLNKKNNINLSSAKLAQRVVMVKKQTDLSDKTLDVTKLSVFLIQFAWWRR